MKLISFISALFFLPLAAQAQLDMERLELLTSSLKNIETVIENALPVDSENKEPMSEDAQKISEAFDRNDCDSNIPEAIENIDVGKDLDFDIPIFEMEVKGEGCPIYLKAGARVEEKGDGKARGQIYIEYQAKSDEFQKHGGLKGMKLVGDFDLVFQGMDSETAPKHIEIGFDFKGDGDSKVVGPFRYQSKVRFTADIRLPGSGGGFGALLDFGIEMNGSESTLLEFEGFRADMKKTTELESIFVPPVITATLNGEPMDPAEYDKLAKQIALPGADAVTDILNPDSGGSGAGMQCVLEVKQKDSFFPPFQADNCMADSHQLMLGQNLYEVKYTYEEDATEVSFENLDSGKSLHTFFLLPDESFQQSVQVENFELTLRCEETVQCGN